ncbi:type IV secretion system protein [Cellulomonas sp. McL0617]|uniref:type IV secretion system protein n=1 Tax=Cellulomonas sp. McL0617 TaxID=3415675 RepID=UPI003CEDD917
MQSTQDAAASYVLGGLGSAFTGGAAQVGEVALAALDSTTSVDLGVGWFRANLAVIAAIALPIVLALFVVQVLTSVLRREPGGLVRAVVGVGKALLGAGLALAVTQLALTAVDGICEYIAAAAGMTIAQAAAEFFDFAALASFAPGLQILLAVALIIGFVLMWGVLLFRKAALILVVVFAPIAFAGSAWDQTRVWTRRWIEVVAALVFCKVVIVVVFVVGASAFTSSGPGQEAGSQPSSGGTAGLSDMLVGIVLLAIAIWAPTLTWRFVHWSGMEAAAVMHGAVAANPISKVARSSATTSRYAAQQVAMSAVTGGAGAAAKGAAGAKAASGTKPAMAAGPAAPPATTTPAMPRSSGGRS